MNEKKICACVGARTRDTQKSKEHYEENFIPAGWNLEYTCLDHPEAASAGNRTGVCLHCGGQLGKKFNIPGELMEDLEAFNKKAFSEDGVSGVFSYVPLKELYLLKAS